MSKQYNKKSIFTTIATALGMYITDIEKYEFVEDTKVNFFEAEDHDYDMAIHTSIGLSQHAKIISTTGDDLGLEVLGAISIEHSEKMRSILMDISNFFEINKSVVRYGVAVEDIVGSYFENTVYKHAFLVNPYLWEIEELILDGIFVKWLYIVPINDFELEYLKREGSGALEKLFMDNKTNVYTRFLYDINELKNTGNKSK